MDEARAVSARTGVEIPEMQPIPGGDGAPKAGGRTGFAGLFGDYLLPTLVLGLMSATGLVLVYSLNTWLPELMLRAGFNGIVTLTWIGREKTSKGRKSAFHAAFRTHVSCFQTSNALVR